MNLSIPLPSPVNVTLSNLALQFQTDADNGYIVRRIPFNAGTVHARTVRDGLIRNVGRLSAAVQAELQWSVSGGPTYIVWSYDTPIAWAFDRTWYFNGDRYSTSTTRHQGIVMASLHNAGLKHKLIMTDVVTGSNA